MKASGVWLTLVLLMAMPALTACTITPERGALVPEKFQMQARHNGSVKVLVSGGNEANMIDGIQISNEVFAGATEDAIKKSGLFTQVTNASASDFRVEVLIQRLMRPTAGFGMESQLSALWVLRATTPERPLWQDLIVSQGAASVGDAFSGLTRMRMAIERAASNNIQRAVQEMSLVEIAPVDRK